jgi:phenylacetic acid degradation operon negative regulatory protein
MAWRKFPFLDPDLPEDLLDRRWPRRQAHSLFHNRHQEWAAAATSYFHSLDDGVIAAPSRLAAGVEA